MKQLVHRLELWQLRDRRVARLGVPGADILADVAAEDVVSDPIAQLLGNRSALLDGQVSNAAPRIELPRRNDGLCRAGVDAASAATAPVRRWRTAICLQRGENSA